MKKMKMMFSMELTLDELRAVREGLAHAGEMVQGAAEYCLRSGDARTAMSAMRDAEAIQKALRLLEDPHVSARKAPSGKDVN